MDKKPEMIHMMGICGTAMGSLAGLLRDLGYQVRGSDQNVYPPMSTKLSELGIKIMEGYKPENLNPRPDRVIVGNVMTRNHSEVQALLSSDIPYTSLPKAMGEFVIRDRHSVVISGTHGKTTTTAMASWVLSQKGGDPGFLIGGVPANFPNSFHIGKGKYFVIEGDEYDTAFFDKVPKFIHYKPRSVICTSVEFDHADIYKDLDAVKKAFLMLMELIPEDGHLIYNADDVNLPSLLSACKAKVKQGYGAKNGDWKLVNPEFKPEGSFFEVHFHGKLEAKVKTQLFGEYNLLNALSVFAICKNLGIPTSQIQEGLETFKGVKRRQEIIGTPHGITVIDDFAHHPTAVRVTIDGVRSRFLKSKIIGVFEPRSATSRRKVFQKEYADALSRADVVILATPFDQSKIDPENRLDAGELLKACERLGKECLLKENVDLIVDEVKARANPGDVVLVMSNGGFGGIYQKLLKVL